MPSKGLISIRI